MATTKFYRQCRLRQQRPGGHTEQVSYIPEKFAQVGNILKLKEGDVWEDGWKVISASERVPENLVPDYHAQIKGHRQNTGDAMSKRGA